MWTPTTGTRVPGVSSSTQILYLPRPEGGLESALNLPTVAPSLGQTVPARQITRETTARREGLAAKRRAEEIPGFFSPENAVTALVVIMFLGYLGVGGSCRVVALRQFSNSSPRARVGCGGLLTSASCHQMRPRRHAALRRVNARQTLSPSR